MSCKPVYKGVKYDSLEAIRQVIMSSVKANKEVETTSIENEFIDSVQDLEQGEMEIVRLEQELEQIYVFRENEEFIPELIILNSLGKMTSDSVQKETGVKVGTKGDINISWINNKTGTSVNQQAHMIWERDMGDGILAANGFDIDVIRDTILEIVQLNKNDVREQYLKKNREKEIKQEIKELKKEINTNTPTVLTNNPLTNAGVRPTDMKGHAKKDIAMAEIATQFIGTKSGSASISSTEKYKDAWGNKANTGIYTSDDVIMLSGSGPWRGVTMPQIKAKLSNFYKPLLEKGIAAGASFVVGNAQGADALIRQYLTGKNYVEQKQDGFSKFVSPNESILNQEQKMGDTAEYDEKNQEFKQIPSNKRVQELRGIPANAIIKMEGGTVLSFESSDVAFHGDAVIKSLDKNDLSSIKHTSPYGGSKKKIEMMYLMTKTLNGDVVKLLRQPIPKFLAISITGAGKTFEKGVLEWQNSMAQVKKAIDLGLDPEDVVIRIDPLYPGVNTPDVAEATIREMVKAAHELGVKQIYTSVFDIYKNTEQSILDKLDLQAYSNGFKTDRNSTQHANEKYLQDTFTKMDQIIFEEGKGEMEQILCGESPSVYPTAHNNTRHIGCLNVERMEKTLGRKTSNAKDRTKQDVEDKGTAVQRENCMCAVTETKNQKGKPMKLKRQGLTGKNACKHCCVGCYVGHKTSPAKWSKDSKELNLKNYTETPTEEVNTEAKVTKPVINKQGKVNIYAGSKENAHLSNFAERPFSDDNQHSNSDVVEFNTVEGAFQAAKLAFSTEYTTETTHGRVINEKGVLLTQRLATATGAEAKKIGRTIKGLAIKAWDKASFEIMYDLMYSSFKQNPQALKELLATGTLELTHTQDKGKWGELFPRALMEVRKNLKEVENEIEASTTINKSIMQNINDYSNNKTTSPNVKIVDNIFANKGNKNIITAFRVNKKIGLLESFKKFNAIGNPIPWEGKEKGQATEEFLNWIFDENTTIEPGYRKELISAFESGNLKGKTIEYYKNLGEPSHATVLDYLINKHDWGSNKTPTNVRNITYTPKGKETQTYTIKGNAIINIDGTEVFKKNSADRTKIFVNLAVKEGRAIVVDNKGSKYAVNNNNIIVSLKTGKVMKWSEENGNRKSIIALADEQRKLNTDGNSKNNKTPSLEEVNNCKS